MLASPHESDRCLCASVLFSAWNIRRGAVLPAAGAEASLSFLGVGVPPGEPAWGIMVAADRNNLIDMWWLSLIPGLAITVVVVAMNLFGDWLRDTLEPKLRRS